MNRLSAVGLAVIAVGLALAGGGVYFSLAQEASISDVEQTEGTVVSTAIEPVEGGFYPNVTYRYEVDGVEYRSSNVFPPAGQRRGADRDDAREVVRGYRADQSVTVYYPGGDPANASLRAPREPTPVFAVGFGLVTFAFGIVIAAAGRQRARDLDVVLDDSPIEGVGSDTDAGEGVTDDAPSGPAEQENGDEDAG